MNFGNSCLEFHRVIQILLWLSVRTDRTARALARGQKYNEIILIECQLYLGVEKLKRSIYLLVEENQIALDWL